MNIDKLFSTFSTAKVFQKGNYIEGDGIFTVKTKQITVKEGEDPLKPGTFFIAEFEIEESTNDAHKVGSTASYVLKLSNPYAMGNIVELVVALLGYEPNKANLENDDIREQADIVTRATLGSDSGKTALAELRKELGAGYGELVGKRLKLETKQRATKPSKTNPTGGVFTAHRWSPIAG